MALAPHLPNIHPVFVALLAQMPAKDLNKAYTGILGEKAATRFTAMFRNTNKMMVNFRPYLKHK